MRKIIGILIMLIATFWFGYYANMILDELQPSDYVIHCFRPPVLISIINSIICAIGFYIGIKIFKKSIRNKIGIIILILLMIIGIGFDHFWYLLM